MRSHPSARLAATLALAAAFLVACAKSPAPAPAPQTAAVPASAMLNTPIQALDPANLDTTCAPCANFFQFANGGWLKLSSIPAAYSRWGTFNELQDRNQEVLRRVLDAAAQNAGHEENPTVKKVGVFYASCMDSSAIEGEGAKPLAEELKRIGEINSLSALQGEFARLHLMNVNVPFGEGSVQDFKSSKDVILILVQGGLGLPDRDYYTRADSQTLKVRAAYVDDIARTLQLLGESPNEATAASADIMAIESALAQASMTRTATRDPKAIYHLMSRAQFDSLAPNVGLSRLLAEWNLASIPSVDVAQPDFFKAVSAMLAGTPLANWKAYLRWHYARVAAPWLSSAFVHANFAFQRTLSGATELLPRWKRCLTVTDASIGEGVGQAYVAVTFPPEAKARALAMVKNMETVLRGRIDSLSWMTPATRAQALSKLDAFVNKIGYPDAWRDYGALEVKRGAFVDNFFAANVFESRRDLAKIGKPVDRLEWRWTPPTVNASYNPLRNEITFPAGILQPPFFDPNADDATNYGGIGAVIGHEMTHGFDDSGRQFDADGNLRDWWTAGDAAEYTRRATLVEQQFNGYVGIDTIHVNGKLTLGENIADLGGLKVAFAAYRLSLKGKPQPPKVDGFTAPQRFFLSYAVVWRQLQRPEALQRQLLTDPHSPGVWRVNGPLSNLPEFAEAFGCKTGDVMVRPDSLRAQIW